MTKLTYRTSESRLKDFILPDEGFDPSARLIQQTYLKKMAYLHDKYANNDRSL